MPHDRLFRALANLALWGDLDELSLGALRKYVGEESVRAALTDDDEESIMREISSLRLLAGTCTGGLSPQQAVSHGGACWACGMARRYHL